MNSIQHDIDILKPLAERYAEFAQLDVQKERLERYRKTIAKETVRPVVLIDEVPWGEIDDDDLVLRCDDQDHRILEDRLRRILYQWNHFQADMVLSPTFYVQKQITSSGIGLEVVEARIESSTGSYAASHEYRDQLNTDEDIEKIVMPEIHLDQDGTDRALSIASSVFEGLMPVTTVGTTFNFNIWDRIAVYRGVDRLLLDLAMRPEFMHKIATKFMEIAKATVDQYLALGLLETNPVLLHCTPACTDELPAADFSGTVRLKDVWGRCAAQIFAAVSPEMHDEFDLVYNQKLFGNCGLLYYGCCEPMDSKIDILCNRFPNLRKISITPWANPDLAADNIGNDYVLAAKPNPAFVNSKVFRPEPVAEEIDSYLHACKRNGTTCEFVLKDISTIANTPDNLGQWANTVEDVINRYY